MPSQVTFTHCSVCGHSMALHDGHALAVQAGKYPDRRAQGLAIAGCPGHVNAPAASALDRRRGWRALITSAVAAAQASRAQRTGARP